MRNLKRALSLALASVMLLGMMVVGTSAASFPDVDANDNTEAIEVLNAVGVMIGDNGNFKPDAPVTRNEMAVIMAKLILGTYAADSYVGVHPFTDVPAWADRYVAACYNAGIIAGRSATTYDGSSTVTAVEAAAMMLRALGYEDLSKDTSVRWDQPVAKKANEVNLFEGMSGASTAPMDRNSVAQLALNSLQANVVDTVRSGSDVNLPGVVEIKSNINYVAVERPSETGNYAGDTTGCAGLGYQQLCEKLYGTNAKALKKTSTPDDFGRDAYRWSYDGKEIGKYADVADASYTKEVKLVDIYKDLGLSGTVAFEYFVDNTTKTTADPYDHATVDNNTAGTEKIGGRGVQIDCYKQFDGSGTLTKVNVCVVNTYAGKVSRVTPAKDGNDRYITITGAGNFETEGFAKDDIVLYTKSGSTVKSAALAEKVADQKVTSYTGASATASKLVAGSTYELSAKGTHKDAIAIDSRYDLYLDSYGYVIYSELYEGGESNYAYVLDVGDDGIFDTEKTNYVKLLLTDGTIVDGKADKDYETGTPWTGRVVTYTINSDNEYELTHKSTTQGAKTITMKPNNAVITVTSGTNINANSSTVFVVGTKGSGANDKFTYTVYTGIANVPKIDNTAVINIAASDGAVAKYVFIQALDSVVSSDSDKTIFVKGATKVLKDQLTAQDKTAYYEYKAMIDGAETTLKVKTNATNIGDLSNNVWLKSVTENKDGYITGVTKYTTGGDYTVIGPTTGTNRDGDAVRMGFAAGPWYTLKKDAPVVVVDGDDMVAGSVTDVNDTADDGIYAVVKDGQIIAMNVVRDGYKDLTVKPTITEGDVMSEITEADVADTPAFKGVTPYVVTGLTATTAADGTITITGTVPTAKQFTAATNSNAGTNVPGFGTLGGTAFFTGKTSTKAAIIPVQAADGTIALWLVGNNTNDADTSATKKDVDFTENGVTYNLDVVFSLTWE